jgi:tRNA U34 5-methylaminomethyl-2-thiouridine-forming methyltransferase MnmC
MNTDELTTTGDGSHTLFNRVAGEHYHSIHGAIQESKHVFIQAGFHFAESLADRLAILEVGFGTGLNCLLSLQESERLDKPVTYTAIEPFPINSAVAASLNYCTFNELTPYQKAFSEMHRETEGTMHLSNHFQLRRICSGFEDALIEPGSFNLVYFDAFSPEAQPGLWKPGIFSGLRAVMQPGGVLVTYCAKGSVRRTMQQAGFATVRLPGPPGKREMLRATAV